MEIKELIQHNFPELDHKSFIDILTDKALIVNVKQGDVVIDYGDYINSVPLVTHGVLKVSRLDQKGNEIFLYYIAGGDTCAASFSCCLVQKRSEIKAVAIEDSTFLAIPLTAADHWMGQFPVWRNFVFNMYDQKLFQLIDTVDRLAFSKLDEQLEDYLNERATALNTNFIETTHQVIANDLNVSREAISRLLKKMEKQRKFGLNGIRSSYLSDQNHLSVLSETLFLYSNRIS